MHEEVGNRLFQDPLFQVRPKLSGVQLLPGDVETDQDRPPEVVRIDPDQSLANRPVLHERCADLSQLHAETVEFDLVVGPP